VALVVHCDTCQRVAKLGDAFDVIGSINPLVMDALVDAADDQRQLAEAISRDRELFDVVSRHGLTEHDLLGAIRALRLNGISPVDLWTLVSHAARQKAVSLPAFGS
jgi:hypothetical protein